MSRIFRLFLDRNFVLSNFYIYVHSLAKFVIPLVFLPVSVRLVGIDEFGEISAIFSYLTLVCFVIDYSVNVYGSAELLKASVEHKDRLIVGLTMLKAAFFVFILIIHGFYFSIWNSDITPSFVVLFFLMGLAAVFDSNWVFLAEKRFDLLCFSTFFSVGTTGLVSSVAYFYFNAPAWLTACGLLAMPLFFNSIFSFVVLNRLRLMFCKTQIQSCLRSGDVSKFIFKYFRIFSSQIVSALYTNTGPIILISLSTPSIAGIWFIANRVCGSVGSLALVPYRALFPEIAKTWSRRGGLSFELVASSSLFLLLVIAIFSVIFVFQEIFVALLFDASPLISLPILLLMFVWSILQFNGPVLTSYLISVDRYQSLIIYNTLVFLVMMGGVWPLVTFYGLVGWFMVMIGSQLITVPAVFKILLGR